VAGQPSRQPVNRRVIGVVQRAVKVKTDRANAGGVKTHAAIL
jgi:hypothetical protein